MSNTSINVRFATGKVPVQRWNVANLITSRLDPYVNFGRSNAWRLQIDDKHPRLSDKQMLLLFKPETLSKGADSARIIDRTFECAADHGYEIEGVSLLSGPYIARQGIIERHYAQINKAYREGGSALSADALDKLSECFGEVPQSCDVLGGESFMKFFGMKPTEINDLWVSSQGFGKVKKLSSGVYATRYDSGRFMAKYLINGFHAGQIANFCAPGRITAAVSLRSGDNASSWAEMRSGFAGATDPSRAKAGSVRNWLLNNRAAIGMETVDTQLNGIHLSAGPIESMAEIPNWFPWVRSHQTVMGRLLGAFMSEEEISDLALNPEVPGQGKPIFDLTEGKEPEAAAPAAYAVKSSRMEP
jgi:hypothetical protein